MKPKLVRENLRKASNWMNYKTLTAWPGRYERSQSEALTLILPSNARVKTIDRMVKACGVDSYNGVSRNYGQTHHKRAFNKATGPTTRKCPNCKAERPTGYGICSRCGSSRFPEMLAFREIQK